MSDKFFIQLLSVSAAHAQMSRNAFQKLGLTEGQPKVLYILKEHNGCVQKELAEICGVRQSTLTVLLTKLEQQGFIRREVCYVSGRKRAFQIFLTDEGEKKADSLYEVVEQMERKCFEGFSKEESEQLMHLMERVEGNIKNEW